MNSKPNQLYIIGINLSTKTELQRISICLFFLVASYTINGVLQEYIFGKRDYKHPDFVTFCHFVIYSLLAFLQTLRYYKKNGEKKSSENSDNEMVVDESVQSLSVDSSLKRILAPSMIQLLVILSFMRATGKCLTNNSLVYLSYPTKVLFKSSKLLVTMLMGFTIGKKYSFLQYAACMCLILGMYTVYTANKKVSIEFHLYGYLFAFLSMIPDSVVGNLQEKMLKVEKLPIFPVMFGSNLLGIFVMLSVCITRGDLIPPIIELFEKPDISFAILGHILVGFIGIQFVHMLTKLHGVYTTQTATAVRKVLTVFLSFVVFPKPFHYLHVVGTLLVFVGILVQIRDKRMRKRLEKETR